jgi:hypothetical protein
MRVFVTLSKRVVNVCPIFNNFLGKLKTFADQIYCSASVNAIPTKKYQKGYIQTSKKCAPSRAAIFARLLLSKLLFYHPTTSRWGFAVILIQVKTD